MIICENLLKIYKTRDIEVVALQGLDLKVGKGELIAIVGNSGSGKSTLLNMLGGIDRPSAGKVEVNGKNLLKLSDAELCNYQKVSVGFVWQNNARNLIPYLTAYENVEVPMIIKGKKSRRKRAIDLLDMVGLSHRKDNQLYQLSGGEQQRVAIALAIANEPVLLLADEPTGSVDTKTMRELMDVLNRLNKELGLTIVIVTHDTNLCKLVNRVVVIRDGRTSSERIRKVSYADELLDLGDAAFTSEEETHEEVVVIDRVGRLQIPEDYLDYLKAEGNNRVTIRKKGEHLTILPYKKLKKGVQNDKKS